MANEVRIRVVAEDKTKGVFGGVKAGMKAVLTGAAALGGGIAIAMVKASGAAREAHKVTAQTNAVIKSTGGVANISAKEVDKLSTALSNKSGIDDEVIKSGANMLLTFTNIRNEAGKGNDVFNQTLPILNDMSVALGQDMKSSAMQVGKALNDPIKGITALKRVGVTFNDEQIKTIKHLVKTGKTAEAQKVILAELRKEFGGSAEAQATWADKAKVAAGNIEEAFGDLVNKTFAPIGKWFVEEGAPAIQDFFEGLSKNKDLKRALKELGDAVKGITDEDFQTMLKKVADALPGIVDGMAKAADSVGEFYDAIVAVNNVVGKEARGGMFDEKGPLGGFTKWVKKNWHDATTSFKKDNGQIIDGIKNMANRVIDWVGKLPGRVKGALKSFGSKIGSEFEQAKDSAIKKAKDLVNRASDWLGRLPGRAKAVLKSLASKIGSEVEQAKDTAVRKIKDMVNRVVDWVHGLPGKAKSAVSSLSAKIGSEVEQAKDLVIRKARDMVNRFIDRMQELVRKAKDQAGRVKGAITDRFKNAKDWLYDEGKKVINGLLDGLKAPWDKVKKWVGGIAKWIKDHKGPISLDKQLLVPAGKALMGGLLEGLKFGFGGVGDFVYKAGSKVSDIIKSIKSSFLGDWSGKIGSLKGGSNKLLNAIRNTFGIGGGTYPGHGERGASKAWDFMIHSKAMGNAIASFAKTFARQLGVMYVIWNKRIWSVQRSSEGWRPYTRYGSSGSPSQMHTNHVHVSLFDRGGMLRGLGINATGQPERVLSPAQTKSFDRLVQVLDRGRGGAANTYITVNAPNGFIGSQDQFRRMLVDMNRRGELQVIKGR